MTKAQREKAERLMLKQMLESNPKLKEVIDGMIDKQNPEMVDVAKNAIQNVLNEAQMRGIHIGWNTFAMMAIRHIQDMTDVEEIKNYFKAEADKAQAKLNVNAKVLP